MVEHHLDTVEVAGSKPASRTTLEKKQSKGEIVTCVSIRHAIEGLIASKQLARRREKYLGELQRVLDQFARSCPDNILEVTEHHVNEFVARHSRSAWTQATLISRISTLFEWAKRRRILTENPCEFIEKVSIDRKPPAVLTPEQAEKAIRSVASKRSRCLAWFALCMFAGLRPDEAAAIEWSSIDFEAQRVTITAASSKVRRHRIVTPKPVFWAWMHTARGAELPIAFQPRRRCIRHVRDAMGLESWPQDVLRHSAASYWLALDKDPSGLAFQLGNSPQVLMRHYWNLQTPETAQRYFSILPG